MVEKAVEDCSQDSSHNEEYKEVETNVPDSFLEPQRPQSEAHEGNDGYHDEDQVEALSLWIFLLDDSIDTSLSHHWLLILYHILWGLVLFQTTTGQQSWIFLQLCDETKGHQEGAQFARVLDVLQIIQLLPDRWHQLQQVMLVCCHSNMEIDASEVVER